MTQQELGAIGGCVSSLSMSETSWREQGGDEEKHSEFSSWLAVSRLLSHSQYTTMDLSDEVQ
jgi:hypothetical protein